MTITQTGRKDKYLSNHYYFFKSLNIHIYIYIGTFFVNHISVYRYIEIYTYKYISVYKHILA